MVGDEERGSRLGLREREWFGFGVTVLVAWFWGVTVLVAWFWGVMGGFDSNGTRDRIEGV
ncbi:uncharacterized protein G2W53_014434 [Senna tora]|uniref:Uncharacterized protein n=1 Tax=Senna tora TaxID=362788 RepID=A0A834WTF9_9FABA|nr:uncharacterized protein G2W53_014434 [Senna tora]